MLTLIMSSKIYNAKIRLSDKYYFL
uniref:Uncharacterized protein n=1 Tax=Anguilla anguilla TaxID=7936 RepID=A0A0E9P826_ANGAN